MEPDKSTVSTTDQQKGSGMPSHQEDGEINFPPVPLELSGLLIRAQDYANVTGTTVQIMLPDFKYGNTQSFAVIPEHAVAAMGGSQPIEGA
ncbi:Uncharacterised protein [Mycobacteroides abscessus subsp. abscessus]|nr:hypothetical protein E3G66_003726 [Mycobacteroides abscessus]SHP06098.1 Uncharacterised protein [Mycobacteroides abscessus subsp. abscessus]SKR95312.1 Uncharacterised protein [Mycobacteroides abscessus subsp. massiliense]SHP20700.1 Uncharacterised protein [Mycobacteroides abscessus subsp. abscessus]SHP91619.1 Uncharacterised protein [Mycobacteroides abscessus subsp. abscessus]